MGGGVLINVLVFTVFVLRFIDNISKLKKK